MGTKVFDEFDDDLEKQVSALQQTVLNLTIREMEVGKLFKVLKWKLTNLGKRKKKTTSA